MAPAALSALGFLCALAFLLPRAAPGITLEDSGELSAAAACLGVAHPPGYALFVLLGGLWLRLLAPLGLEPGAALASFSAVCGAATVALLVRALAARGARWSGLAAGLALLQAGPFVTQAIVVEVYALAALCVALALRAALAASPRPLALGCCLGLSIAAHPAAAGALPLALAALAPAGPRAARALRLATGLALGLFPLLAVWLLAQGDPPLCWGQPDTWERFSAHVLRSQYGPGAGLAAESAWRCCPSWSGGPWGYGYLWPWAWAPLPKRPAAAEAPATTLRRPWPRSGPWRWPPPARCSCAMEPGRTRCPTTTRARA